MCEETGIPRPKVDSNGNEITYTTKLCKRTPTAIYKVGKTQAIRAELVVLEKKKGQDECKCRGEANFDSNNPPFVVTCQQSRVRFNRKH